MEEGMGDVAIDINGPDKSRDEPDKSRDEFDATLHFVRFVDFPDEFEGTNHSADAPGVLVAVRDSRMLVCTHHSQEVTSFGE
jgi:hypothetical protein